MYLQHLVEESKKRYKKPSMLLVTPPATWRKNIHLKDLHVLNFPDEEILTMFSENKRTEAIVIDGSDPFDCMSDLRRFIFSARKFFEAGSRPLIVIYTHYFYDEVQKLPSWGGLYCDILQYGNVYIKHGRYNDKKRKQYMNKSLGVRLYRSEGVIAYVGFQYP